jgi:antitoxin component YwqK of YwqJK toxin-antitoxin module
MLYKADATSKPKPATRYTETYENGNLKLKGRLDNGVRKGIWVYYNDKGMVVKKEHYKKGTLKLTRFYNEKGKLSKIIDAQGKERVLNDCGCSP